jgi:hypothetical protein
MDSDSCYGIVGYGIMIGSLEELLNVDKITNFLGHEKPDRDDVPALGWSGPDMDEFFDKLNDDGWFLNWENHSIDCECVLYSAPDYPWDLSDFGKLITQKMVEDEIIRVLGPYLKEGITEQSVRDRIGYLRTLAEC